MSPQQCISGGGGGSRSFWLRGGRSCLLFLLLLTFWDTSSNNGRGSVSAIRVHDTDRSPFFHPYPENKLRTIHEEQQQRERRLRSLTAKKNFTRLTVPKSPDAHLVTSLPLLDPAEFDTAHWAGHLPVDKSGIRGLFYWLFAPDQRHVRDPDLIRNDRDIPLVIWLQGGPGCSSMDGLFLENGPFRFVPVDDRGENDKTTTTKNTHKLVAANYSWHKTPAYVMYVDQPIGTGLSYNQNGGVDHNDDAVNEHFHYFLQSFFKLHGGKMLVEERNGVQTVNRPFYIAGESYAGHFISNFVATILRKNDQVVGTDNGGDAGAGADAGAAGADAFIKIPVAGAAIGNGWIDPMYQYSAAEVAYGHGLIGYAQMRALQDKERDCQEQLKSGMTWIWECRDMLDDVVDNSHGEESSMRVNMYNVRYEERSDVPRDYPPGHKTIEQVLGGWHHRDAGTFDDGVTDAFVRAVHAELTYEAGQYYMECNLSPFEGMRTSEGLDARDEIVEILHHPDKVRLLFYNGVDDLVINHIGNDRALENVPWKLQDPWIKAVRHAWKSSEDREYQVSGYMKSFANLHFLKILRSGHMVPMEVPGIAFDMIRTFIYRGSFKTRKQILGRVNKPRECPICPAEQNVDS